jgi:hypothetical protein
MALRQGLLSGEALYSRKTIHYKVFRTIELKRLYYRFLLETGRQFMEACQMVVDYSFSEQTFNKNNLDRGTYVA